VPPTPLELFVEGFSETLPTASEILTFQSNASGTVTGTVRVPTGVPDVIVRFRLRNEVGYAPTNYVVADVLTDVTDNLGRVSRSFTITGLVPGQVYGLVAQAVDATLLAISIPTWEVLVCITGAASVFEPYLPGGVLEYTEFPKPDSKDLLHQVRMIEDLYTHQCPQIEYYPLKKLPTPALEGLVVNPNVLSGEPGTTKFDPLWGESVPETVAATGKWTQPHGKALQSVNGREKYDGPYLLRSQIRRDAKERQLKKWGFDEIRDIIVTVPVSHLDRFGIRVDAGDQFVWDGERYTVLKKARDGYWFNTNVRLYVVISAEHYREGS
jgi:hypothetical protein